MHSIRKAVIRTVLAVLAGVGLSSAYAGEAVKVMTRNMDAGTDFGFFIANLQTDPALGVQQTLQEVLKNDFPARAWQLAKEIASTKPDLVGLQEVTVWSLPTAGGTVTIDQLELLLQALSSDQYNVPYTVVAANTLTNLGFPIPGVGVARFTDRDVVIRRVGSAVTTSNPSSHSYTQLVPLTPDITVKRGWISVDATVGARTFEFVTTHLESSAGLYGNPQVDLIQAAQAQQLAQVFADRPDPVVIAGDFNSNATNTPPDQTQSFNIMLGEGYVDAWSALHRGIPGFTWPLYVEDPLQNRTQGPLVRIDFVFSKDVYPTSVTRTGLQRPFGSDHAGVLATFDF